MRPESSHSKITSQDYVRIYRLLNECLDLWADPEAWQRHFLGGINRMTGLKVGLSAKVRGFGSGQQPDFQWRQEHGWEEEAHREALHRLYFERSRGPFRVSPIHRNFRSALAPDSVTTCPLTQMLDPQEWKRSDVYNLHYRPGGLDQLLYSAAPLGDDLHHILFLGGRTAPDERACEIVKLAHAELARLIGVRLSTPDDVSLAGLTPRQHEVLMAMNRGLPEKLIADRLGITGPTVSEHVQHIYRHFGVHSRSELMAHFIHRLPRRRER